MSRGVFITLEGGEGSGKSTLAKHLYEFLQSKDIGVLQTREPGGTPEAEAIRSLVVTGDKDRFDPLAETLLLNAARRHHLKHSVLPALEAGSWVICDRFVDSTFVYQGFAQGVELCFLETLHLQSCWGIFPNLTFLLDVPVDIGLYRTTRRLYGLQEARFEQKGQQFHEIVRKGFIELSYKYADRYCVLDGALPEEEVSTVAIQRLQEQLQRQSNIAS